MIKLDLSKENLVFKKLTYIITKFYYTASATLIKELHLLSSCALCKSPKYSYFIYSNSK